MITIRQGFIYVIPVTEAIKIIADAGKLGNHEGRCNVTVRIIPSFGGEPEKLEFKIMPVEQ